MTGLGAILNVVTVLIGAALFLLIGCTSEAIIPSTATNEPALSAIPTLAVAPTQTRYVDLLDTDNWPDPCTPPEEVAVDGEAAANVLTWHDLNENGEIDDDEPFLSGIKFFVDNSWRAPVTDERGRGRDAEFMPGCACDCWEGSNVIVVVPPEFFPTTPGIKLLTGEEETYLFGFVEPSSEDKSPAERALSTLFSSKGLNVTHIYYNEATTFLYVEFRWTDEDAMALALRDLLLSSTDIRAIEIRTAGGYALVCDMEVIEQHANSLSAATLSRICQYAVAAP